MDRQQQRLSLRGSRRLENGIVKISIWTDDYPLATRRMPLAEWRRDLLDSFRDRELLAFGLHDRYARECLDSYEDHLQELAQLGGFMTADELRDPTFRQ